MLPHELDPLQLDRNPLHVVARELRLPRHDLAGAVVNHIKKKGTLTGGNPPTFERIIEVP